LTIVEGCDEYSRVDGDSLPLYFSRSMGEASTY